MYAFHTELAMQSIATDSGWDVDYDSGSSYDYDYDSGSSYDDDYDYDYDYYDSDSSHSSSSGSYSGDVDLGTVIFAITFVLVVIVIITVASHSKTTRKKSLKKLNIALLLGVAWLVLILFPSFAPVLFVGLLFVLLFGGFFFSMFSKKQDIKIYDELPPSHYVSTPEDQKYLELGYKIFRDVQMAWMNFDEDTLRKLVTDELYHTYQNQLGVLKLKGQQNIMKDFVVKKQSIIGKQVEGNVTTLKMQLEVEFYDYVVNDKKEIVRGTDQRKVHMQYLLTFVCDETSSDTCPSCGGKLENAVTVCPYCQSPIQGLGTSMRLAKKEGRPGKLERENGLVKLKELEPEFNEDMFVAKVDNLFTRLLESLSSQDLDPISSSLGDNLRRQLEKRMDSMKKSSEIQKYEEINVNRTEIKNVQVLPDKYRVSVQITSYYKSYKIDSQTKLLKSGDENKKKHVEYLTLEEKRERKNLGIAAKCPNCGAPIDYNQTGVCPYCQSAIPKEEYDWVVVSWSED